MKDLVTGHLVGTTRGLVNAARAKVDMLRNEKVSNLEFQVNRGRFSLTDASGEVLVGSGRRNAGIIDKLLGGGPIEFRNRGQRVCEISQAEFGYDQKRYDLTSYRNSGYTLFENENMKVSVVLPPNHLQVNFSCEGAFELQCLAISCFTWHRYLLSG